VSDELNNICLAAPYSYMSSASLQYFFSAHSLASCVSLRASESLEPVENQILYSSKMLLLFLLISLPHRPLFITFLFMTRLLITLFSKRLIFPIQPSRSAYFLFSLVPYFVLFVI